MYSWIASFISSTETPQDNKQDSIYVNNTTASFPVEDWTWIEVIKEDNDQEIIIQTSEEARSQIILGPDLPKKKRKPKRNISSALFSKGLYNDMPVFTKAKPSPRLLKRSTHHTIDVRAICKRERSISEIISADTLFYGNEFRLPFERLDYCDVLEKASFVRFIMEIILRSQCKKATKTKRTKPSERLRFKTGHSLLKDQPLAIEWKTNLSIGWKGTPLAIEYRELPLPIESPPEILAIKDRKTVLSIESNPALLAIEGPPTLPACPDTSSIKWCPNSCEYLVEVSSRWLLPEWMKNLDVIEEPCDKSLLNFDYDLFDQQTFTDWVSRMDVAEENKTPFFGPVCIPHYDKIDLHVIPAWQVKPVFRPFQNCNEEDIIPISEWTLSIDKSENEINVGSQSRPGSGSVWGQNGEEAYVHAIPKWLLSIDIDVMNEKTRPVFGPIKMPNNYEEDKEAGLIFGPLRLPNYDEAIHEFPEWMLAIDANLMEDDSSPHFGPAWIPNYLHNIPEWMLSIEINVLNDEFRPAFGPVGMPIYEEVSFKKIFEYMNEYDTPPLRQKNEDAIPHWMKNIVIPEQCNTALEKQIEAEQSSFPNWMKRIQTCESMYKETNPKNFSNTITQDLACWMGFTKTDIAANLCQTGSKILRECFISCECDKLKSTCLKRITKEEHGTKWYQPEPLVAKAQSICDSMMGVAMIIATCTNVCSPNSTRRPSLSVESDSDEKKKAVCKKKLPTQLKRKSSYSKGSNKIIKRSNALKSFCLTKQKRSPKSYSGRGGQRAC